MKKRKFIESFLGKLAIIFLTVYSERIIAEDLVSPGIQTKMSAGAGQTVSRGALAIFFSPANLIYSRPIEPIVGLGFSSFSYSYTPSDESYKTINWSSAAPVASLGVAFRPTESFSFGFCFSPMTLAKTVKAEEIPFEFSLGLGEKRASISRTRSGQDFGAGLSFRPVRTFATGLAFVNRSRQESFSAYDLAAPDAFVIDYNKSGSATQIVLGSRLEFLDRRIVVALSYKTASMLVYTGEIADNSNGEGLTYYDIESTDFLPSRFGLGLETRIWDIALFFDVTSEQWSGGRKDQKAGLISDLSETDLVNSNKFAGGLKFWRGSHMFQISGSMTEPNVAFGVRAVQSSSLMQEESQTETLEVQGVRFAEIEALSRTTVSGGYRFHIKEDGYFITLVQYTKGSRTVPQDFRGAGSYSLQNVLFNVGLAYGL